MRGFKQFSRMFLAGGVLVASALCLSSCGDYTFYDVHVMSATGSGATVREFITGCKMTITNENGHDVLRGFALTGCEGGLVTKADVGHFSYSSSRTSGTLTFQVDANDHTDAIIQTGNSGPIGISGSPIPVTVNMLPP